MIKCFADVFSALERVTNENGFSVLHHALFGTTDLNVPLQDLHPAILDENKAIKFINSKCNITHGCQY